MLSRQSFGPSLLIRLSERPPTGPMAQKRNAPLLKRTARADRDQRNAPVGEQKNRVTLKSTEDSQSLTCDKSRKYNNRDQEGKNYEYEKLTMPGSPVSQTDTPKGGMFLCSIISAIKESGYVQSSSPDDAGSETRRTTQLDKRDGICVTGVRIGRGCQSYYPINCTSKCQSIARIAYQGRSAWTATEPTHTKCNAAAPVYAFALPPQLIRSARFEELVDAYTTLRDGPQSQAVETTTCQIRAEIIRRGART